MEMADGNPIFGNGWLLQTTRKIGKLNPLLTMILQVLHFHLFFRIVTDGDGYVTREKMSTNYNLQKLLEEVNINGCSKEKGPEIEN